MAQSSSAKQEESEEREGKYHLVLEGVNINYDVAEGAVWVRGAVFQRAKDAI
jgi:hypothetical protein